VYEGRFGRATKEGRSGVPSGGATTLGLWSLTANCTGWPSRRGRVVQVIAGVGVYQVESQVPRRTRRALTLQIRKEVHVMRRRRHLEIGVALALSVLLGGIAVEGAPAGDPLPSWNEGPTKAAIVGFVKKVTKKGSSGFVPEAERIATFDNDGTLWAEQPMYFQLIFAIDRVKAMAADHPEWKDTEPFKSAVAGDMKGLMATGKEGLAKVLAASHADMTAEEFAEAVRQWTETAEHPTTGRRYTEMVYQPMLELLDYLRASGFKTFIVSGGGIDFMRVFAERVYGIPPEQVVGSQIDAEFELRGGIPTIVKTPRLVLIDDQEGKPVGIYRNIGRRPIFAGGNSDGDLQMLQYTTIARDSSDTTPRFGLIVHHTDAEREWAYDRGSHIGGLDEALDEAGQRGWVVVDMKKDWGRIYPGSGH
jgi:phosphoglycolate phosphatase-like HAD superfamily hydrolase